MWLLRIYYVIITWYLCYYYVISMRILRYYILFYIIWRIFLHVVLFTLAHTTFPPKKTKLGHHLCVTQHIKLYLCQYASFTTIDSCSTYFHTTKSAACHFLFQTTTHCFQQFSAMRQVNIAPADAATLWMVRLLCNCGIIMLLLCYYYVIIVRLVWLCDWCAIIMLFLWH